MKLIQFKDRESQQRVGIVEENHVTELQSVTSIYELFEHAGFHPGTLQGTASSLAGDTEHNYTELAENRQVLLPVHHPDPYHTWITGTGLTHMGSAESRDSMHQKIKNKEEEKLTDSMRMFRMGLEDGKKQDGQPASQPEWFYKGNGLCARAPGRALELPPFSLDGGEEPEIAGIYIIDPEGQPQRLGYCLSNDFSDHKMEQINYLYLAHSKLRPCSYGPELLLGELPKNIKGTSRIYRQNDLLWEKEFLTGEDNMTHNIANLEHHHFKYELFRQPGDLHIHMFGTSVLSFGEGVETKDGDLFKIEADCFDHPLVNQLKWQR